MPVSQSTYKSFLPVLQPRSRIGAFSGILACAFALAQVVLPSTHVLKQQGSKFWLHYTTCEAGEKRRESRTLLPLL